MLLISLGRLAWDDFFAGRRAYEKGDYATALREFRPLADQGNVNTQGLLGLVCYNGQRVAQDYAGAVRWYRKAAARHNGNRRV